MKGFPRRSQVLDASPSSPTHCFQTQLGGGNYLWEVGSWVSCWIEWRGHGSSFLAIDKVLQLNNYLAMCSLNISALKSRFPQLHPQHSAGEILASLPEDDPILWALQSTESFHSPNLSSKNPGCCPRLSLPWLGDGSEFNRG